MNEIKNIPNDFGRLALFICVRARRPLPTLELASDAASFLALHQSSSAPPHHAKDIKMSFTG